ncbi:putative selenate reductase subunit YgfK [Sporomusaceae bacterium FL31]|nr:putative selenate reductase subunit YgfK [Sporomusaceae bacterium FL31]
MGDIMRPISLRELIKRMFQEFATARTIFALPEISFFRKRSNKLVSLFGETCETPLGPAAGPHTQLAQNIITAYLAGSRFIELKTVQEQEPPVAKPCIDAEDEAFNTEWSSEYPVEQAYDEYIKAWIVLHLLEEIFELRTGRQRSFLFNMSVGYNMQGLKSARMDAYINNLMNASAQPAFMNYLDDLAWVLQQENFFKNTGLEKKLVSLKDLPDRISPVICKSVTLSTMHGCPSSEIEKICAYLLTEKKLATYVKLNPTLLSFPIVKQMLATLGFDYITLSEESFTHDLQYQAAIPMLNRLQQLAQTTQGFFGVKLTNTLGSVNFKNKLPGSEMYLSGRPLFPLAINLAARISQEFNGQLSISFSAGISEHNAAAVFATGIKPLTLATELLKPGGYNRLSAIATKLENLDGWENTRIDTVKVADLAEKSLQADYTQKSYRGKNKASLQEKLPLYDCAEAPCKMACPIHQDIPEYIRLVGQQRYEEALALIYQNNALPAITSHICDHACQYHCTRLDYEGCVLIREVKRIAVKKGFAAYKSKFALPVEKNGISVAVMGAGPAGLASAYFLAREGFSVTVFETRPSAGGTVRHVIPRFRISNAIIDSDVTFIKEHGVTFIFNTDPHLTPKLLQSQGFTYVVVAVGANAEKSFNIPSSAANPPRVISALKFLEDFNHPSVLNLGKHVAVVGAGNTAMDASRTALRVPGVETVSVIYRRTEQEMPAYREEYELALADHVQFNFLLNPESFTADNTLLCRVMQLGEADASGRRQPEPTDQTCQLKIDTLITAIGETVNHPLLSRLGLHPGQPIPDTIFVVGDANIGPSSIVQCIADGRKAADAICLAVNPSWQRLQFIPAPATAEQAEQINHKKLGLMKPSVLSPIETSKVNTSIGQQEYQRCLECNYVCNKCVEVCPNRANITVTVPSMRNHYQIVHLDAYCNECGNCATFCPWRGKPYTDKVTLFSTKEDFTDSNNPGFLLEGRTLLVRLDNITYEIGLDQAHDTLPPNIRTMLAMVNEIRAQRPSLFGPVES